MGGFANIFKMLRLRENLTQQELADKLGIAKSTISMYENENREPDLESLEAIADFFNVDMDFLIGRKNTEKAQNAYLYQPTYEDIQSLIARNGKKLTIEQKQDIIRTLLSDD